MTGRVRLRLRGPMRSTSLYDDDECECGDPWKAALLGIGATVIGGILTPVAQRLGQRISEAVFGPDDDVEEVDLADVIEALQRAQAEAADEDE